MKLHYHNSILFVFVTQIINPPVFYFILFYFFSLLCHLHTFTFCLHPQNHAIISFSAIPKAKIRLMQKQKNISFSLFIFPVGRTQKTVFCSLFWFRRIWSTAIESRQAQDYTQFIRTLANQPLT